MFGFLGQTPGETVETSCGSVRGIISKSRDGREFYEWRGIPFGKPPVGELRFASPQPFGKWEGIRDGGKFGNRCPELSLIGAATGNEDCLYLNIAAPKIDSKPLPVLFFIHGGAFQNGCGSIYRPDYFMDEDCIFITTNYRLGVLGFISTGDSVIRGNMGLKDQVLALRWVKDNIAAFGGDTNNITIFGESAGGASVHHLMLSPTTEGLFHKAISQSGVAIQHWACEPAETAVKYTRKLAEKFNCSTDDSSKIAECLRSKTVQELLTAYVDGMGFMFSPHKEYHMLKPIVETVQDDEAFLTEFPIDIVQQGRAKRIPWMVGVTADEGLLTSLLFYASHQKVASFENNWDNCILWNFGIPKDAPNKEIHASKIKEIYFPEDPSRTHEQKLEQFTKLFSDANFNLHVSRNIGLQRNLSPVYPYYFSRRGGPSLATVLSVILKRGNVAMKVVKLIVSFVYNKVTGQKPRDYGVCHGDDIPMLFVLDKLFSIPRNPESKDYKFSKDMVKLWVDFAKDESSMTFRGVSFPALNSNGPIQYFDISEPPKLIHEPFADRTDALKALNFFSVADPKGKL